MTIYLLFFRPSSKEVLAHCLFWSKEKQLKFFQEVSDWIQWALKEQPLGSTTVVDLEVGVENVFKNEWLDNVDEELKQGITTIKQCLDIYKEAERLLAQTQ